MVASTTVAQVFDDLARRLASCIPSSTRCYHAVLFFAIGRWTDRDDFLTTYEHATLQPYLTQIASDLETASDNSGRRAAT